MLKRWITKALMTCLIASATFMPAKSHAFLVVYGAGMLIPGLWATTDHSSPFPVATCLILLPLCVLDGGDAGPGVARADQLAANGYSRDEIALIVAGQTELTSRLAASGGRIVRGGREDFASLETAVRAVYPEASPIYMGFLAENFGAAPR